MIEIQHNISLKPYNTFGLDVNAKDFCEVTSIEELLELRTLAEFDQAKLWLGGGSNILLTRNFNGLVIKISIKGRELISRTDSSAKVAAYAGENWHNFVQWTLENKLGGIENLSLIPGNVGTAPMQNIGAYGVEIKDVFHSLEALNLESGKLETFTNKQCRFGYRESIFKNKLKGKYVIVKVLFDLTPEEKHILNTSYGAIEEELKTHNLTPSIHTVSQAVINIRKSKLPDPNDIGNAGSFFKNPVVDLYKLEDLRKSFSDLKFYKLSDMEFKIPAGWLIEYNGWKGYKEEDVGVHNKQALVLVNHGKAKGYQIESLSKAIRASIFNTFGIKLETEVNII